MYHIETTSPKYQAGEKLSNTNSMNDTNDHRGRIRANRPFRGVRRQAAQNFFCPSVRKTYDKSKPDEEGRVKAGTMKKKAIL